MNNFDIDISNPEPSEVSPSERNQYDYTTEDLYEVKDQKTHTNVKDHDDQNGFFQSVLENRGGVFPNEKWDRAKSKIIDGIIEDIHDNLAHVVCLMNPEKLIFKEKIFPMDILSAINSIEIGSYIRVVIKQKAGSIRYDFYDGSGMISDEGKQLLDSEYGWNELEDFPIDDPSDIQ